MARVPADFEDEFGAKGNTFFEIAELLYFNPDRQYTQDELAEKFGCSTTISNHTRDMSEWLYRRNDQTTYAWNTEVHNPASTEGLTAVKQFYTELWTLLKKHTNTAPGVYAVLGLLLLLAAFVVFMFYVAFSLSITQQSAIPVIIYLAIAIGSFVSGVIVTLLSPFQAIVNGLI
jgi:hypothetical protein